MGRVLRTLMCLICLSIAAESARCSDGTMQTVRLGVYVPPIVRWLGTDPQSTTASAVLTLRPDALGSLPLEVSHVFRLLMNVDVVIDARVTPFRDRRDPSDELDTYWQIVDDADGDRARTGALPQGAGAEEGYGAYVPTHMFLREGLYVTHAPTDGAVKLTVTAQARSRGGDSTALDRVARVYDAQVTLTALPQTGRSPAYPVRRAPRLEPPRQLGQ